MSCLYLNASPCLDFCQFPLTALAHTKGPARGFRKQCDHMCRKLRQPLVEPVRPAER